MILFFEVVVICVYVENRAAKRRFHMSSELNSKLRVSITERSATERIDVSNTEQQSR